MVNKSMPDLVKVGFSTKDPTLRAKELNSTGLPYEFQVAYDILVDEPRGVEQKAHGILSNVKERKEFFKCDVKHAVIAIHKACKNTFYNENYILLDRDDVYSSEEEIREKERQERIQEEKRRLQVMDDIQREIDEADIRIREKKRQDEKIRLQEIEDKQREKEQAAISEREKRRQKKEQERINAWKASMKQQKLIAKKYLATDKNSLILKYNFRYSLPYILVSSIWVYHSYDFDNTFIVAQQNISAIIILSISFMFLASMYGFCLFMVVRALDKKLKLGLHKKLDETNEGYEGIYKNLNIRFPEELVKSKLMFKELPIHKEIKLCVQLVPIADLTHNKRIYSTCYSFSIENKSNFNIRALRVESEIFTKPYLLDVFCPPHGVNSVFSIEMLKEKVHCDREKEYQCLITNIYGY